MPLPRRRAYHLVYDTTLVEALEYASKSDWNGIVPDFGVPEFSPDRTTFYERTQLRRMSDELNIEWGMHLPGDDVSLMVTYPHIRQGVLDYFREVIDFAREVSKQTANVVVHAGTPPSFKQAGQSSDAFSEDRQEFFVSLLCESLTELIYHSRGTANIVLENHAWSPIVHEAIDRMVPKGLKLCMDIPKLYNPRLIADDWVVFEKHRDAIEVVHVHDFKNGFGEHQIVGDGSINFETAVNLLSSLESTPQYVFEVRPREAAEKSLVNFSKILDSMKVTL